MQMSEKRDGTQEGTRERKREGKRRGTRKAADALFAFALALCAAWVPPPGMAAERKGEAKAAPPVTSTAPPASSARTAAELMDVVMWNREPIGGPFKLIDHHGKTRRDTDFRGRLMLVYFGFTFCPDICPTDLQQISLLMDQLGTSAKSVAPLFITLDAERDTQKLLAQYVPAFNPQITGLTGDAKAIRAAADAYKVYYAKVPNQGASRYSIDHSSFIYLMGRDGKYLGYFPPGTPAARMLTVVRGHLGQTGVGAIPARSGTPK